MKKNGSGFIVALLGLWGVGKTQMAVEVIRHHIKTIEYPSALYVRAISIFMAVREAYSPDGPREVVQIEKYISPKLLVIEDAHERADTDWVTQMLSHIVDRRYGQMKDTILISNETEDAFRNSIGEGIYTRLVETGGIIKCDWESFRKAKP